MAAEALAAFELLAAIETPSTTWLQVGTYEHAGGAGLSYITYL